VATTLLRCVQREAAARDLRLVLDVAVHNQAAITFWQQHGWRRVGEAMLPLGDAGQVLPLVLLVAPRGAPL
jgi:ribosomal protein S18 acetylase RimI-like enzyme